VEADGRGGFTASDPESSAAAELLEAVLVTRSSAARWRCRHFRARDGRILLEAGSDAQKKEWLAIASGDAIPRPPSSPTARAKSA
jgi:hypothetical protein